MRKNTSILTLKFKLFYVLGHSRKTPVLGRDYVTRPTPDLTPSVLHCTLPHSRLSVLNCLQFLPSLQNSMRAPMLMTTQVLNKIYA